jgi:hypothetical protein
MFVYGKERGQGAAALAKWAGGVRLNICAISAAFRFFHPGQNPARATPTSVSRNGVAARRAASPAWPVSLGSHGRRTSPETAPRSTRAGPRPSRQHHCAPQITGRSPLSALALQRLWPHDKLHLSDARPRRPALPEMQRRELPAHAVSERCIVPDHQSTLAHAMRHSVCSRSIVSSDCLWLVSRRPASARCKP